MTIKPERDLNQIMFIIPIAFLFLFAIGIPGIYFGIFESEDPSASEIGGLVWLSVPAFAVGVWWLLWFVYWIINLFRPGLVFEENAVTIPPKGMFQLRPATVAYGEITELHFRRTGGGQTYILVVWTGGKRKLWSFDYPDRHNEILQVLRQRTGVLAGLRLCPECGHVNTQKGNFCDVCTAML